MICSNCGSDSKEIFGIAGDNLVYKCVACYALQPEIAIEARSRLELDSDVSYEIYSQVIASLNPSYVAAFEFKVPSVLKVLWSDLKELASHLKSEFGIGLEEVVKAFQQKSIFALLKGVAFSLKKLVSAIHDGISILSKELYKALAALHDSGAFKHVEKSAKAVDAILEAHPVLKKLAGPAVAGILLVIYLKSSFLGDLNKDLALVDALVACLKGQFTIYELFASKDGIYALATLAIGLITGASAISYGYSTVEKTLKFLGSDGHNVYNLALAIFYAAAKKAKIEFNHKESTRILGMKLEAKQRLVETDVRSRILAKRQKSKPMDISKVSMESTKPQLRKLCQKFEKISKKFYNLSQKDSKGTNSNFSDFCEEAPRELSDCLKSFAASLAEAIKKSNPKCKVTLDEDDFDGDNGGSDIYGYGTLGITLDGKSAEINFDWGIFSRSAGISIILPSKTFSYKSRSNDASAENMEATFSKFLKFFEQKGLSA